MADPLVINIPHRLGKDEALRRVKPAPGEAVENWNGKIARAEGRR